MIREGYELDPSQVELAVAWLNENGMDRPVPMAEALAETIVKVEAMPELPANGKVGNGRSFDNIKATKGGTDTEYTLRRLKRDAPELLQAVKRGELSVNAAAIKAGIRKKPTAEERLQTPHVCDQSAPEYEACFVFGLLQTPCVCDQSAPYPIAAEIPIRSRRCDPGEARGVGGDVFV